MRCASSILSVVASLTLSGPLALAEELSLSDAPQNTSAEAANRPARGMSMRSVESKYGTPASRVPAVGTPPISRWEYPGFVVFFEHDHVIHTVAIG